MIGELAIISAAGRNDTESATTELRAPIDSSYSLFFTLHRRIGKS
jgi:hypothetical protein